MRTKIHLFILSLFVFAACDTPNDIMSDSNTDNNDSLQSLKLAENESNLLSWDWRVDENFKDWNGNQIPSPWYQEFHRGVDLAEANRCQPSDGWELYIKRLEASDWTSQAVSQNNTTTTPENPYFALYNRHTGVLRLFVYLGGDNTVGEDYFVVNNGIETSNEETVDTGLFLHDSGDHAYSLSEKNAKLNENKITSFQFAAVYNKWIVQDYILSYDPELSTYNNIFLRVDIGAVKESDIALTGEFNYEMQDVTLGGQNTINALIDDVFGSSGKIKRRMSDITQFQDNLEKIGGDFEESPGFLGDLGSSLLSFASLVDPTLSTIGLSIGVLDYVN